MGGAGARDWNNAHIPLPPPPSCSHNSISDIGAEQIGRALQTNQVLEGLYLWHNRVFHSGAEALALGLACNKSLKSLGVRNVEVWSEDVGGGEMWVEGSVE